MCPLCGDSMHKDFDGFSYKYHQACIDKGILWEMWITETQWIDSCIAFKLKEDKRLGRKRKQDLYETYESHVAEMAAMAQAELIPTLVPDTLIAGSLDLDDDDVHGDNGNGDNPAYESETQVVVLAGPVAETSEETSQETFEDTSEQASAYAPTMEQAMQEVVVQTVAKKAKLMVMLNHLRNDLNFMKAALDAMEDQLKDL
jgi:hypothetical protein